MGRFGRAFSLARRKVVSDLFGSYGRAALSGLVTLLIGVASYAVLRELRRNDPSDALLPLILAPCVLIAVGLVGLLINWIAVVPYSQWGSLDDRVAELERQMKPRFSVLSHAGQTAKGVDYGVTHTTFGGTRQSLFGKLRGLI